ncbi:MAG TPA: preprotein translocase subunit SecD [Candidatus Egerieicola pullicola]|uniref:Protein translocase subunit SecD n=1 Tax=Candidatus Egerieicola pullicola TaxID=2840775 RepID=A0A9D1AIL7_9FIRM|nr:preprotein translocase subunit SecD [Candidatus Egerieicola pullicola]
MKKTGKPVFFIVAIITIVFTVLSITGISSYYGDIQSVYIKGGDQIRWGIDIRGGVEVTFVPQGDADPTNEELDGAAEVMRQRLVAQGINDYSVYSDYNSDRIVVQFPWAEDEENFDPESAIAELGTTAQLRFIEGTETDSEGNPTGEVILDGSMVENARAAYVATDKQGGNYQWVVELTLNDEGAAAFSTATSELVSSNGQIAIWMDDQMISAPAVNQAITDGEAMITGNFDSESATTLANQINGGALPFSLETASYSTIDPTMGEGARDAMILAAVIAFVLICIFMLVVYRLPGVVAIIALMGQVALMIAALTGFFPGISSSTLTLPGIAGMILSIGMGVDANIITAERIREEINAGKSIDGAIHLGYHRAFSAILDGNITTLIVAIILMGTFGAPGSFFNTIMQPILFMFPASTEGTIYSFGFTLMVGIVGNFVFGVFASRLMTQSLSRFKCFRKPKFYGGERA